MDTQSADPAAAPAKHEYLLIAEGCTLAAACAYLRDTGCRILGHEQRDDGRWVVKIMAEVAS